MSADPSAVPTAPAPGAARRRSTVLAAVETFLQMDPGITLNSVLVFLYVAENQGLNLSELAAVSRLRKPTASRSIRALAARGAPGARPPYLGLIQVRTGGIARNSKTITLTPAGLDLCRTLERHIGERIFIDAGPPPAGEEPAG